MEIEIRIKGSGTREDIIKAIELLSAELKSNKNIDDIGGDFNDNTITVELFKL